MVTLSPTSTIASCKPRCTALAVQSAFTIIAMFSVIFAWQIGQAYLMKKPPLWPKPSLNPRLADRSDLSIPGPGRIAILTHLYGGMFVLLLGSVQPLLALPWLRDRYQAVRRLHRYVGCLYLSACIIVSLGGLGFILRRGTAGGFSMDLAFATYGFTLLVSAAITWLQAVRQHSASHRAWAVRTCVASGWH